MIRLSSIVIAVVMTALGSVAYAAGDAAEADWSYVFVDGDAEAGKSKIATCTACHAADGNSPLAINPKLAGQNASYLLAQLKHFKSGARENAVMKGMVAPLSEQDMKDIAVYYSEQSIKTGAADEDLVALGESVYRGGDKETGIAACTGCHGPAGKGNPGALYPALAGQHAEYIAAQLYAYRKELRTNPMAETMQSVALHMTDKEIDAVASYIEGLY